MPHGRHATLLAGLGLFWGGCLAGCQTVHWPGATAAREVAAAPAVPPLTAPPLAPRTVVAWSIESYYHQPTRVLAGQDTVGPDGTLRLGPYGTVQVSGLTPAEAKKAIEQHVAGYVREPHVSVTASQPAELRTVSAEVGEPRNEILAQATESSGRVVLEAPVAQAPAAAARSSDSRGRTVIASNWRPVERVAAPTPTGVQSAEWLVRRQANEKPDAAKQAEKSDKTDKTDKPATEPAPEQLTLPTPLAGPEGVVAPPVSILPPVAHHGAGAPRELAKVALPPYVIEPPDILLIEYGEAQGIFKDFPVQGQHLVRPDGTVSLGVYGSVQVAGLTIDQAKEVILQQLSKRAKSGDKIDEKLLNVDVLAYNSKFYYVIFDGGGYGEQVARFPVTGSDTVIDAIAQVNGLPAVASKKHVWVARRCPTAPGGQRVLPVDWIGITQHGSIETNYQIMPGDRIYVRADKLIKIDTGLAKFLSPIERVLGVTLLGSQTVNSIRTNPNRVGTAGTGTTTGR
jgi:polysaccharide biosynthesis/export protein